MVWLDGLDIPLVAMFNAGFAENGESDEQVVTAPEGTSDAKYASGLLPVDWKPARQTSPIFNYPYARTREALQGLAKAGPPDACHGYKLRYVNPASGGAPIATMGTFMQLLPKGFASAPYRSTDGTIFSVVEGEGESVIGDKTFRWKKRDHFVVPSWATRRAQGQERGRAVLLLRPTGSGEARSVARGSRRALACERALRCERKHQGFDRPLDIQKRRIGAAVDAIHEALQFDLVGIARWYRYGRALRFVR